MDFHWRLSGLLTIFHRFETAKELQKKDWCAFSYSHTPQFKLIAQIIFFVWLFKYFFFFNCDQYQIPVWAGHGLQKKITKMLHAPVWR